MEAVIKTNSLILLIIGNVSTISVIFLTYLLIRKFIKAPLSHTVAAIKAIAEGDLTRRVDIRSGDEFGEFGELAESFNTMA
ncbi:MAG: HAMP domain-containing protein [Candidatus Scalindua sp.]